MGSARNGVHKTVKTLHNRGESHPFREGPTGPPMGLQTLHPRELLAAHEGFGSNRGAYAPTLPCT